MPRPSSAPAVLPSPQNQRARPCPGTTDHTERCHPPDTQYGQSGPLARTTAATEPPWPAAPTPNTPTQSAQRSPTPASKASEPATPGPAPHRHRTSNPLVCVHTSAEYPPPTPPAQCCEPRQPVGQSP